VLIGPQLSSSSPTPRSSSSLGALTVQTLRGVSVPRRCLSISSNERLCTWWRTWARNAGPAGSSFRSTRAAGWLISISKYLPWFLSGSTYEILIFSMGSEEPNPEEVGRTYWKMGEHLPIAATKRIETPKKKLGRNISNLGIDIIYMQIFTHDLYI